MAPIFTDLPGWSIKLRQGRKRVLSV